jgi:hypothetical protein
MSDSLWFAIAVVLLLGCLAAGWRRWGERDLGLTGEGSLAKFVIISTTVGGLLGAPFWWLDLPASFAWDLPPVASRMLAAAAFAFGLAGLVVLERPRETLTRLYLALIAVYLVPLAIAVVALHLDRLNFLAPVTYGFFAVVIVLSAGSLMLLSRRAGNVAPVLPRAPVRLWLLVAGSALMVWGIALFAAPATSYPLIFNWAKDPLSSRLIAAMLVTVGAAFLLSRRDAARSTLALVFAGAYGVGVSGACLANAAAGLPVPPLYSSAFVLIAVVSLFLLATTGSRDGSSRPG